MGHSAGAVGLSIRDALGVEGFFIEDHFEYVYTNARDEEHIQDVHVQDRGRNTRWQRSFNVCTVSAHIPLRSLALATSGHK